MVFRTVAVAIAVCVVGVESSRAGEFVTEALFADNTFISGPLVIESETPHFLMIRYYRHARKWRTGMFSKGSIRYLLYGDHAVPYVNGSPQESMQLSRSKHFPGKSLLVLGLTSFGASVFMLHRSRTADEKYRLLSPGIPEIADQKARQLRRRERFELYSGLSMVLGFGLSLAGLSWESNWTLADDTVILPIPGGRYQIRARAPAF
jgi:hypothetical protein